MADFKLTPEQIKQVEEKKWDVIPKGFYIEIHSEEENFGSICSALSIKDAGRCESIDLLIIGTARNKEV